MAYVNVRRAALGTPAIGLAGAGVVLLVILQPRAALYASLIAVVGVLLTQPLGRLIFIIGGALAFLQGNSTGGKLGYLAVTAAIVLLAILRLPQAFAERPDLRCFRPLLRASGAFGVYCVLTYFVSQRNGTPALDWARDVAPYLLFAALPVVGVEAAARLSARSVERLLLVVGVISGLAFTVDWLGRRGVTNLGVSRIGFASFSLCVLTFCYALARTGTGRNRLPWILLAIGLPAGLLVTGTRSSLVLAVAILGVVGSKSKKRLPVARVAAITLLVTTALAVVLPPLAGAVTNDPAFLQKRLGSVGSYLGGGATVDTDQSFLIRQQQYELARASIRDHPLTGTGPGRRYRVSFGPGDEADTFTLDTPYVTPAKLGLLGVIALLGYVIAAAVAIRKLRLARGYSTGMTAARCFVLVVAAFTPFGSLAEDKGSALAVMLLVALLGTEVPREAVDVAPERLAQPARPRLSRTGAWTLPDGVSR